MHPFWRAAPPTQVDCHVARLLARVESYCRARNWSEGYFGKVVVGDDRIVGRIRETGRVFVVTLASIERYLDEAARAEAEDRD